MNVIMKCTDLKKLDHNCRASLGRADRANAQALKFETPPQNMKYILCTIIMYNNIGDFNFVNFQPNS